MMCACVYIYSTIIIITQPSDTISTQTKFANLYDLILVDKRLNFRLLLNNIFSGVSVFWVKQQFFCASHCDE